MSVAHRTVPPYLTRLALQAGVAAGLDRSRLAGVPGLAALDDDRIRVPTASALRVWELLAGLAPNGDAGGRVLELWRPGALGVWDYLFSSAGTLAEAMTTAIGHFAALGDPNSRFITAREPDGGLTVGWHSHYHDHPAYAVHTEFTLALLLAEASSAVGRPVAPARVRLPQPAPADHAHLAELYGTRHLDFAADRPSVTFSPADADAPLPRADPALLAILGDHARSTVLTARPVLGWLDRFHSALEAAFTTEPPELADVAHRLALSPRTLQRRLGEEGTSWRAELEEARRIRVDRLLRDPSLTLDTIATRAGYTDPRALRRAIHRWYGQGPGAVRAAARADAGVPGPVSGGWGPPAPAR